MSGYTDTFVVTVADTTGNADTATVTVTVTADNDVPSAKDASDSTDEDTPVSGTINASDPDIDDTLTYTISITPTYGSATIDDAATGDWTYTPVNRDADYIDSFVVTVEDTWGHTVPATVTITVDAANDRPIISLSKDPLNYQSTGAAVIIDSTAIVVDTDSSDFDGGTLTVEIIEGKQTGDVLSFDDSGEFAMLFGNITYNGDSIGTVATGNPLSFTFNATATLEIVDALASTITFVTPANTTGTRVVRYTVSDGDGGTSVPRTKTINVMSNDVDLQISNSDGGSVASADSYIVYTFTYANIGGLNATNVKITTDVPNKTTYLSMLSTGGWICSPNINAGSTCTFTIGDLLSGDSGYITFAVTVDSSLGGTNAIENTASIAGDETEPDTTNNSSTDSTPIVDNLFYQTNGPRDSIVYGDWYSSSDSSNGGNGYHYFFIQVPPGWIDSILIDIDLYSPAIHSSSSGKDVKQGGFADDTYFEVFEPGTVFSAPDQPGPGAAGSIDAFKKTYSPTNDLETWERLCSITNPVPGGRYILRTHTGNLSGPNNQQNDRNGWSLRVGYDDDGNVVTPPRTDYDLIPGTNDEITFGIVQTELNQRDLPGSANPSTCQTLYEYVAPGLSSVAFHNYDILDGGGLGVWQLVRYYSPSSAYDPIGQTGGIAGTVTGSDNDYIWNQGDHSTRGGDVINNPEPGWWRIVSCMRNGNRYVQEGQEDVPAYYGQPPTPAMQVSMDDGQASASVGDTLSYSVDFANSASGATPGAANSVIMTATLASNVAFQGCTLTGVSGTCTHIGNNVIITLDEALNAQGTIAPYEGNATITAQVTAAGSVVSMVELDYQDGLGNQYVTEAGVDVTSVP